MHIPRATYRFQFNENFRLEDALALVPYLHELGISHVYASPLFAATPHSTHGYDVCDFGKLNPELGTEDDLEKLVAALHEKKMGLVVDIVPNHMGVGPPENFWWWDVLKHGEKSMFAGCFDIDWQPDEENLRGKILVPVLGDRYDTLVNKGEFQLQHEQGAHVIAYHEHRFPLAPDSVKGLPQTADDLKAFNATFTAVDQLIRRQNYRLEFYKEGDAKINYRRFFAVSTLAAVRVDDEKIFDATHALLRRWYDHGWIDGLRVDHPDGLRDPEQYLKRLRALAPEAWIVVEKIIEPGEPLPGNWPIAGTTGYDFLNQVNGLFVDAAGEKSFTGFYQQFTGDTSDYQTEVREKKREVLKTILIAEINRLTGLLAKILAEHAPEKRFSVDELRDALSEIIACFPVYRSYISETTPASPVDVANINGAVQMARELRPNLPAEIFKLIHDLLLNPPAGKDAYNFIARFQQLTGPVMAKGVEDTVFYCYNRFTSLNEVGGDPGHFGTSLPAFHQFLQQQQTAWPLTQLTTSTHDTKRAEDVRARLNVLSEMPDLWREKAGRWSQMNEPFRQNDFPDRNMEYLFYQTLVGAWPLSTGRAWFYMEKSAQESKQHTTWTERNTRYEEALKHFVTTTMADGPFMEDVEKFVASLADAAAVNSLAQTLIKLTAPGVPDIYQGCELWDWSTVDPDNRRPVDFELRQELLAESKSFTPEKIWNARGTGLPKLWMLKKTLNLRAAIPDFTALEYRPLFARGEKAENVVAFARGRELVTIVPRFWHKLKNNWADTTLELPPDSWRNEFTGEKCAGVVRLEKFFEKFPVALLARKED